jgi:hypothetical protein
VAPTAAQTAFFLPATTIHVATELGRISKKHRGSSTGPTKNFREVCFTCSGNVQWPSVAPSLLELAILFFDNFGQKKKKKK